MNLPNLQNSLGSGGLALDGSLDPTQTPKQPGMFRRILGMAVGVAGNMFMPGLGGMLGNLIGGGGSAGLGNLIGGGSGGLGNGAAGAIAGGANQIASQGAAYLQLLRQVDQEQEGIQTMGAVLKSKHDALMDVIQDLKG